MPKSSEASGEITHFPNGNVKVRRKHLDGEMRGEWKWFRTDGTRMRTGAFDRGKQIGVWPTYDRSGKVVKETDFG